MAEEKVRTERLMKRVGELEDRTITLTTHLRNNEKQYLLLKHKSSVTERLLREETEGHKVWPARSPLVCCPAQRMGALIVLAWSVGCS
jgi:hypothetical protein